MNFSHYLHHSEENIGRLRCIINHRPVAIVLHGHSLSEFEERITEIGDCDICYITLNDFVAPEKHILRKINHKFSILMRSSYPIERLQINEIINDFLEREEDNIYISEKPSFEPLIAEGFDYDGFVQKYDKKLLFFLSEASYISKTNGTSFLCVPNSEYPLHLPRLNSFSALLALTLIGQPSKVVVFGGDGGKIKGQDIYYRNGAAEFIQKHSKEYLEDLLVGDTILFNKMMPALVEQVNKVYNLKPVEIINCSLHSNYTPFKKLTYDDTFAMLKSSRKKNVTFAVPDTFNTAPLPKSSENKLQSSAIRHHKSRLLYIPLEFRTWADASHWSYPAGLGLEEGFEVNGVEYVTIPAIHNVPSSSPTSWLNRIHDLCAGMQFDQVWFEISHSNIEEPFLDWLSKTVPIRVGFLCESLDTDPREWANNPEGTQKRLKTIEKCLPYLTHMVAADEADVDRFNAEGRVHAMWWAGGVLPERWICKEPPSTTKDYAVFYGALYGERKIWLENKILKGLLVRPEASPEHATDLPRYFDDLHVTTEQYLKSGKSGKDGFLSSYLQALRLIRRECFSLWLRGLQNGRAIVNLPQFGKMYAGRVVEGMAAGRPVIACEIPGRPKTRDLFEDGKEILLYSSDNPDQLASHIQRVLREPDFGKWISENARNKVLEFHTTEKFIKKILNWIENKDGLSGERPSIVASKVITPTNKYQSSEISNISHVLNTFSSSLSQLPIEEIHDFNQRDRDKWIREKASTVPADVKVLDVGAGTCPYRELFAHCQYKTLDFKKYDGLKLGNTTEYGSIDYVSEITDIPVPEDVFDIILCTEVLEHVPEPIAALKELSRILCIGGQMLLTVPLGAGLHQLPYHYYGGYTPEWFKHFCPKFDLYITEITPNGGLFKLVAQLIARVSGALPEHPDLREKNVEPLRRLFGDWIPRYLFTLEEKHFDEQFTVGYHVAATKIKSLDTVQSMINKDPQNISLYIAAARFLINKNNEKLAKTFIEDALELDYKNSAVLEIYQELTNKKVRAL